MANWRERGYVPDSDDEEDESLGEQPSTAAPSKNGSGEEPNSTKNGLQPLRQDETEVVETIKPPPSSLILGTTLQFSSSDDAHDESEVPTSAAHIGPQESIPAHNDEPVPKDEPSVAEQIQAQLRRGLDLCEEIRSSPPPPPLSEADTDSPLSSPPESPQRSLHRIPSPRPPSNLQATPQDSATPIPASTIQRQPAPIARSLRMRTAVQLQPYTLDVAKHRTEWQSRGLRPVHMRESTQGHHHGARPREEESQGDETFSSSQPPSSPPRSSLRRMESAADAFDSRRFGHSQQEMEIDQEDEVGTDDELPDIMDILADPPHDRDHVVQNKSSNRRVYTKKRVVPSVEIPKRQSTGAVRTPREGRGNHAGSIFDLPPSPPRSGSEPPFGIGLSSVTPRPLPTPFVSSDKQPVKRNFVEVSSSPEEARSLAEADGESSGEESSGEEPQSLMQIRRRIRGVLPASWIRIDARQQKSKTDKHASSRSPEKRPTKGVARHVSPRPGSRSGIRPLVLDVSSGDEEESASSQQKEDLIGRTAALWSLFDSDQQDVAMDDVIEDNAIDRMAPGGSRRSGKVNPRKKHQQRLDHSLVFGKLDRQTAALTSTAPSGNSRTRQSYDTVPKSKRLKKKSTLAQLSILDAPGLMRLDHQLQPRFLRVAARSKVPGQRAKLQDPTRKFFQLATREDTAEVNEELSSWRAGRKLHKTRKSRTNTASHPGDQHRPRQPSSFAAQRQQHAYPPVAQDDYNNNNNRSALSTTLQLLKDSTDATLARLQHHPESNPSRAHEATSSAVQPTLTASAKRNPGFVSWHSNRAGRGNFWNRILSRPAQLETPVVPSSSHARIRRLALSSQLKQPQSDQQTASLLVTRSSVVPPSRPKKPFAPRRTLTRAKMDTPNPEDHSIGLDAADVDNLSLVERPQNIRSAVINLATSKPAVLAKPPTDTRLQLSTLVCGGKLATLIDSAKTSTWSTEASITVNTTLSVPNDDRELHCTDHTPEVMAFIQEIMDEAMGTSSLHNIQSRDGNALECVEGILQYMDEGIRLFSDSERGALVVDMTRCLDAALTFLSSQTTPGGDVSGTLPLLNRIMLLAYQTHVGSKKLATEIQTAANKVFTRAGFITLELILTTPVLQNLIEVPSAWDSISFDNKTLVYLESLFFWFHLTQASSASNLEKDLRQVSTKLYGDAAESFMAVVMTLLPLLYSMSFTDTSALFKSYQVVQFDPWTVLGPAFRGFLDAFGKQKRHKWPDVLLGLQTLKSCLSLAIDCDWPIPDALLQLLFKHYGKNDMLELFIAPDVSAAVERVSGTLATDAGLEVTDFEIFLRLVTKSLEQKSLSLDDTSMANSRKSKIVGLVFSLTPNNSRIVDEQDQLENHVRQTMANTYALYASLYSAAPRGCRPRVAQIENLLNFSTSHAQVRDLTIAAWARMSRSAVTKGADLDELQSLGLLGQKMWRALAGKVTAGLDANTLSKSYFQYDLDFANCQPVIAQMCNMIQHWNTIVVSCTASNDVGGIINTSILSDMLQLLHFLQDHFEKVESFRSESYRKYITKYREHDMDMSILNLMYSIYTRASVTLKTEVLKVVRDATSRILSNSEESSSRLEKLVSVWFDIAKARVANVRDRWTQYLEDGATLSLRFLADTKISHQCEALLLSHIVEQVPAYFELDPEGLYSRWLRCILKPQDDLRFEHILTNRVITRNPGNLPLHEINNLIDNTDKSGVLSLKTFTHYRADIVKHVIRCIYGLQFVGPEDSQDLIEELVDEDSGRRLLGQMADTLKTNWLRRNNDGADPAYTRFVQAVAHELEIYTFPGFKLSKWFTDPQESEFAVAEDRFKLLFTRPPGSFSRDLDAAFVTRFRQDNQKASNTPSQGEWIQKLVAALSCTSMFEDVDSDGNSVMDGHLQVQFMQNVLSVYIQFSFSKGPRLAVWTVPVVQILIQVIRDIHLRQDVHDEGRLAELAAMCLELLMRARQALDCLVRQDAIRQSHIMMLAVKLIELATCCIGRIHEACRVQPRCQQTQDLRQTMEEMAAAIHDCITDKRFDARLDRDEPQGTATSMEYYPETFKPIAVPGTDDEIRQATVDDIDEALTRGRQPLGLGENWSFWYQNGCETHTGWEAMLDAEGEILALAAATKKFCRVADAAGACEDEGRWQQWENLARHGARAMPAAEEGEGSEEDEVAETWEE